MNNLQNKDLIEVEGMTSLVLLSYGQAINNKKHLLPAGERLLTNQFPKESEHTKSFDIDCKCNAVNTKRTKSLVWKLLQS
jgi:hypothetical protein